MMTLSTTEQMPLKTDTDGVLRVGGTRVPLDTIVVLFEQGLTAEEIAQRFSSLDLADVYFAIGYYLRHRSEIDQYLKERKQLADDLRVQNETKFNQHGLRERLLARSAPQKPGNE